MQWACKALHRLHRNNFEVQPKHFDMNFGGVFRPALSGGIDWWRME